MPELQAVYILFQGTFHALMWVGNNDKPIVHNANKGQFYGVLQQSLKGAIGVGRLEFALIGVWGKRYGRDQRTGRNVDHQYATGTKVRVGHVGERRRLGQSS